MSLSVETVREALASVVDPNTGHDLVSGRCVRNIRVDDGHVSLDVELGYPALSQIGPIREAVTQAVRQLPGVDGVSAHVYQKIVAHAVQRGVKLLPQVRNIIAVASGKGGVGKSTMTANLALALAAEGATVGVLDADIYGPSQPLMFGISGQPQTTDGKSMEPMENHGVQVSSIGFLIDVDTPMVWRGPLVTQALEQLLRQTQWRDLDYLLIDMPPGTGDVHLTLSQKVPVTGAVIVTTPQDIALLDARKGYKMFEKVGIPVMGVVENMAMHVCSQCGHVEHIFGAGGGERMAAEYGLEYLGGLPLDIRIRENADSGRPTVVADPEGELAAQYRKIARRVAVRVAEKARDMSSKFPSIVVQNT
ncbi:MAG: iron-sulfur cluster carrier protein ApbC [Lautropia sp.]|nr:iron-sulfur cluster carrier protein ApbC [Lautropia sp.]